MNMLSECKCVMCEHWTFDFSFEHKCKAYPNGIPDDIFADNSDNKNCKADGYNFKMKPKDNRP